MGSFPEIPGAGKLLQWFGDDSSFHDGEVLELHLDRSKTSWIRIMTVYKPAIVTFILEDITDLELADFSCQNVISSLGLEKRDGVFRLTMGPCYGIAGFIDAKRISVDVAPRA
jgi:hypothetical protein